MYESPLNKIYKDITTQIIKQDEDNFMYAVNQAVEYTVDKQELIKALQYDRNQYEKGYADAKKEYEDKMGHCKDCRYFEHDSFAKVDGIPLIVAHEICSKWGNGCKTKEDGYCFMFEQQESEE